MVDEAENGDEATMTSTPRRLARARTVMAAAAVAVVAVAIGPSAEATPSSTGTPANQVQQSDDDWGDWYEYDGYLDYQGDQDDIVVDDGESRQRADLDSYSSSVDFDLYLYAWDSYYGQWELVDQDTSSSPDAYIDYSGDYGVIYAWVVYSYSGQGGYTLYVD